MNKRRDRKSPNEYSLNFNIGKDQYGKSSDDYERQDFWKQKIALSKYLNEYENLSPSNTFSTITEDIRDVRQHETSTGNLVLSSERNSNCSTLRVQLELDMTNKMTAMKDDIVKTYDNKILDMNNSFEEKLKGKVHYVLFTGAVAALLLLGGVIYYLSYGGLIETTKKNSEDIAEIKSNIKMIEVKIEHNEIPLNLVK